MNHRLLVLFSAIFAWLAVSVVSAADDQTVTEGRLDAVGPQGVALGPCPLKHTSVDAEISGPFARVSVTQTFHNPFREKIEAIYVFPLHQDAAVDDMTMTVGERVVKGVIKERDEARKVYDEAKASGKVASLLDQQRPNIFSQAVANIEPGQEVTITIRYSQTVTWEDGRYHFDFPTVVGPRYIPGKVSPDGQAVPEVSREEHPQRGPQGEPPVVNPNPSPATDEVPDANRITPPVVEEGFRAGHDLSINVRIHAGLPVSDIKSALHEIKVEQADPASAVITLAEKNAIPNRDFAISYRTAGDQITDAVFTHTDAKGKYFTLLLQPPARVVPAGVLPRELIFVLDTSGSMNGFPIETSKALIRRAIENLRPADRFNIITFAGDTSILFKKPVANTEENRNRALRFIDTLKGAGGTEMMKAIETALGDDHDPEKVRMVCFLTDGYVGNDLAIVAAVKQHAATARVFSFGIGTSVNRFLLDSMARAGRGEACYILSQNEAKKAADKFYERIDAPVLTDISLEFENLAVDEVFPNRIEDLFAARPVIVKGRYIKGGSGDIKLKGRTAAGDFERRVAVSFPEENAENLVLAGQWARAKVDHLMMQDMAGVQRDQMKPELKQEIIKLGIDYHLMTQFTSFVAVEEKVTTEGGAPRTIQVPVEMPEGVSYSGNYGPVSQKNKGGGLGFGGGSGNGLGGGTGKLFGLIPETMRKRCSKEDRLQRLKENGGTPACEDAVQASLAWLTQHQNSDGSWCDSNQTAMTGLALLAYLGHCETPMSEKNGETVMKAIVYLINVSIKNQDGSPDKTGGPQWPYANAIASTALAEALTFCKDLKIEVPFLEKAVQGDTQAIIDRQLKNGGWASSEAKPKEGDILLTCANLQALKAASHTSVKFTGLKTSVMTALQFISSDKNASTDPAMAGACAFAFQQWGKGKDKLVGVACETIARKPKFQWESADLNALQNDAYAMIQFGGKSWADFNAGFLPELLKSQDKDGSFKKTGVEAGARFTGNAMMEAHYRTCLATLALEVYYRFDSGS